MKTGVRHKGFGNFFLNDGDTTFEKLLGDNFSKLKKERKHQSLKSKCPRKIHGNETIPKTSGTKKKSQRLSEGKDRL